MFSSTYTIQIILVLNETNIYQRWQYQNIKHAYMYGSSENKAYSHSNLVWILPDNVTPIYFNYTFPSKLLNPRCMIVQILSHFTHLWRGLNMYPIQGIVLFYIPSFMHIICVCERIMLTCFSFLCTGYTSTRYIYLFLIAYHVFFCAVGFIP